MFCNSAIVLRPLKPPTALNPIRRYLALVHSSHGVHLWYGMKDLDKEQRIGVLEGSPVHIAKKVPTVDQGSGVNGEATPLSQLLAPNTFRWRGFVISYGIIYLKWLNLCLFKENLLWSHV